MEELYNDDNPFVLDQCFRSIYAVFGGNRARTTEHVNVILKAKAKEGRLVDAGIHFDMLKRCNRNASVNTESYDQIVRCVLNLKEYQLADMINEYMKRLKAPLVSEGVYKELQEAAGKADFENYCNWTYQNGPVPPLEQEKEEIFAKLEQEIVSTFHKMQPSFDKIPVIPDRDV